jgi:deazaflavin-dependent oxidoreductase (nitroreductase family)
MDATVRRALDRSQTIDLTTTGRRTGRPRRIEIALHNVDGRLVISGIPVPGRTRAWLLNVAANPAVTLHLRARTDAPAADVEGEARVVTDPIQRRQLLERVARAWGRTDLDAMVEHSPLMEIRVPGYAPAEDPGRVA